MSSAICFNLDQSKILSSGNGLTGPIAVLQHISINKLSIYGTMASVVKKKQYHVPKIASEIPDNIKLSSLRMRVGNSNCFMRTFKNIIGRYRAFFVINSDLTPCDIKTMLSENRLVVLGFNASLTAKVLSWRSLTQMCSWLSHTSTNTTFFTKPATIFLTCFGGERRNTPQRKFASTGYRTHNHQVMSQTRLPLSHQGRENRVWCICKKYRHRLLTWLKPFATGQVICTDYLFYLVIE